MKKLILGVIFSASLAACGNLTTDPLQNALNNTADTCAKVGASIKALDAAVITGSIAKAVAVRAQAGLVAANNGCASALSSLSAASSPASAAK